MAYAFFAKDWTTNRELLRYKSATIETIDEPGDLEFVLMHGWHSLYAPLLPLENALRALPGGERIRFWRVTYDSHWKTFTQTSRQVTTLLRRKRVRPEKTVLLGYSMGGLVARSMIAGGFGASRVFTLATPHHGAAPWVPVGDLGSLSIAPWSARLARLNSNAVDRSRRGDYFLMGVDFTDATGYRPHDRMVMLRSALAENLEGIGERHTVHLRYRGIAPGVDPHVRGMEPRYLQPLLEKCQKLFGELSERPKAPSETAASTR